MQFPLERPLGIFAAPSSRAASIAHATRRHAPATVDKKSRMPGALVKKVQPRQEGKESDYIFIRS